MIRDTVKPSQGLVLPLKRGGIFMVRQIWERLRALLDLAPVRRLTTLPKEILVGLAVSLVSLLLVLAEAFVPLEATLYDLRFELKPRAAQSPLISVMEIDDDSLKYIGRWPWRRNVYAEVLDVLRTLGARQVVFDVEFTEPSARVISQQDMVEFPRYVRGEMDGLRREISAFRTTLQSGQVRNPGAILADFERSISSRRDSIVGRLSQVGQNDDQAFALAIARHGRVVIPVRCYDESNQVSAAHDQVVREYGMRLATPTNKMRGLLRARWLDIPAPPLHRGARRLAFTNVDTDEDGVRRRIALFREWHGLLFPQLAFAALLAVPGSESEGVTATNIEYLPGSHALLKNILLPGESSPRNIRIPLDKRGQMLINWAGSWQESFSRFSFSDLFAYIEAGKALRGLLSEVDREYFEDQGGLAPLVRQLERLVAKSRSGKALTTNELHEIEALEAHIYTIGTNELAVMQQSLEGMQEQNPTAPESVNLRTSISNIRQGLAIYERLQQKVAAHVRGAYVIIGQTASSTTDLGTTPLGINQPQVFLHANTLNTILQHSFISTMPGGIEIGVLLLLPLVFGYVSRRLRPSRIILMGAFFLAAFALVNQLLFGAGIWMQLAPQSFALLVTFLVITGIHYVRGDKEKKFIKNAFGHYLATEVIDILVKDPAALKLGGERKVLTAYFSDVQGFSTISENLSPETLVDLLNAYLTDMTDIIFQYQGTVDKFEGDAIIAFFGAPVSYEDHAARACLASLEMQSRVEEMRPLWKEKYGHELFVRMGLNTGPMVVGNMGSRNRFDYTMMGDSVNLAARLEGVNKYYGTFTMASEFTVRDIGDEIVTRELDILRVVGKNEPVRVYELVARRGQVSPEKEKVLERFAEGLAAYRKKSWAAAQKHFTAAMSIDPEDGPSKVYYERCAGFRKKAPPANWDGVYTLKGK